MPKHHIRFTLFSQTVCVIAQPHYIVACRIISLSSQIDLNKRKYHKIIPYSQKKKCKLKAMRCFCSSIYIAKRRTCKLFETFKKENYLGLPLDKQTLFSFSKLRISFHKLEFELGRYNNILANERYFKFVFVSRIK